MTPAPTLQFELAELQNCDILKDAFKADSVIEFRMMQSELRKD